MYDGTPPDTTLVNLTAVPFETLDLFNFNVEVRGALTFTVKYFLSIVPFASLTLIQTSYFVAAAGLIVAFAVVLKPFTVVHDDEDEDALL